VLQDDGKMSKASLNGSKSAAAAAAADNGRNGMPAVPPAAQPGRAAQKQAAPVAKRIWRFLSDELDEEEAEWLAQLERVSPVDAVWQTKRAKHKQIDTEQDSLSLSPLFLSLSLSLSLSLCVCVCVCVLHNCVYTTLVV
jgi:hypothetical protein